VTAVTARSKDEAVTIVTDGLPQGGDNRPRQYPFGLKGFAAL
jgi:hypothetical protein